MKALSLRRQILVAVIFTGLLPLVALFLCTNGFMGNTIRNSEQDRIININGQMVSHLQLLMEGMASRLKSLETNPIVSDLDAEIGARMGELGRLQRANESFIDISLYRDSGYLIESTTKDLPKMKDETTWFEAALEGETTISLPTVIFGNEELVFSIYIPLFNKKSEVENVIVARHDFGRIRKLINESSLGEKNGKFVLLDQGGRMLISSGNDPYSESAYFPGMTLAALKDKSSGVHTSSDGVENLYSVKHFSVGNSELALLVLEPLSSVKQLVSTSQIALLFALAMTFVFATLIGLVVTSIITKDVGSLNESARLVASGDLDVTVEANGFLEGRELAESFNLMVSKIKGHNEKLEFLVAKRTKNLEKSEQNLKHTTARLRAAFNESKDGILVTDSNGYVIMGNCVFSSLLDLPNLDHSELSETELRDHLIGKIKKKKDDREFLGAMLKPNSIFEREVNLIKTGAGDNYCVAALFTTPITDSLGETSGRLWVLRDLTEKRVLEENLRQSQKLEALGTLAGGVAHDFNNLLTGIYGHLSLLEMEDLGENHEDKKELLIRAMHASRRATSLVKKLLGFSRRSHIDLCPCNAIEIVEETKDLISSTINPKVTVDASNLDVNAWHVLSDPALLSQIVMNMSVNAVDAMPDGGNLKYTTKNCVISEKDAQVHPDSRAGDYLCLIIEDNGEGIPKEIQKQIFDPFFTTKEQGKGTGLGLATCLGIAQQLGGWIDFESEIGEGTTFFIYIPRSKELQQGVEVKTTQAVIGRGQGETLLLVDDEMVVRSVAEKLLSKMGYNIITASDGEEAIEIFEKGDQQIDLVLLDMTMPKKSGDETFTEIRERFDYVPVLICSGYLVDLSTFQSAEGSVPDGFVQKPYKIENMTAAVRAVIDQAMTQAA